MQTILITGGIGAGKSWTIDWLKKRLFSVFEADFEAKKLLKSNSLCFSKLKKIFFEAYFYLPNGEFDRKKLAQSIFQNEKKRKAMSDIIHPLVRKTFNQFVENQKKDGKIQVFYEAPLISKSILDSCDKTILITCPIFIRKQRLIAKGWTEKEIDERLLGQIPDSDVKDRMDFIIDNSGDFKKLELQLNHMLLLLNKKNNYFS